MKTSEDLFILIRSMSKSEKGYFKKNSFDGKYLNLFDEIDKQASSDDSYNENTIRIKFKDNNLTFTKNYLYNSILGTLYSYHRNESELIYITQLTGFAEILFKKGVTKQSLKIIEKAKTLSYNKGLYHLLPLLISIEKQVLMSLHSEMDFETRYKKVYEEEKSIYLILKNLNEYKFYSDSIAVMVSKGNIFRNKPDRTKADNIVKQTLFRNEKNAICGESKILFYHTLATYYFSIFNFDKALYHVKRLLQLIETDNNFGSKKPYNYLITIQNYVYLCLNKHKLKEAKNSLNKSEEILMSNEAIPDAYRNILHSRNFILRIQILQAECRFSECVNYLENNIDNLIKMELELNHELNNIIRICVSTSYFLNNNFDDALLWLNKILNDKNAETRSDIYCAAKIFNMLLHYELGNVLHLEYVFKSTYQYLLKKKKLFKFENVLLSLFKKIPDLKSSKEFLIILKTTRTDLKKIFDDPYERQVLNYFDFSSWLESKIEGLPVGEYLIKNYLNQ